MLYSQALSADQVNDHLQALRQEAAQARLVQGQPGVFARLLNALRRHRPSAGPLPRHSVRHS